MPPNVFCLIALLGGWPQVALSMIAFRHKYASPFAINFLGRYLAVVMINIAWSRFMTGHYEMQEISFVLGATLCAAGYVQKDFAPRWLKKKWGNIFQYRLYLATSIGYKFYPRRWRQ